MPCSLHTVVAMTMVYRRITRLIFTGSKVLGFTPLAFWLTSKMLSLVTDHVELSVVLTTGLTEAARRFLLPYLMPTTPQDKLHDSFRKHIFIIYVFSFLVSSYITFYLGPMLPTRMQVLPALTLVRVLKTSVLLAAAALVAGIFVFARYFAKVGIIRCSPYPLLSNPMDDKLRYLLNLPRSLLRPDHSNSSTHQTIQLGRRLQHPSTKEYITHLTIAIVAGLITYALLMPIVWPLVPAAALHLDDLVQKTCLLSIIAVTTFSLVHLFDSSSHELDPYQYIHPHDVDYKSKTKKESPKIFFVLAVASPIVSISLVNYFLTESSAAKGTLVALGIILEVFCGLLATYIYAIDFSIRRSLFLPQNFRELIGELSDNTTLVVQLDVILNSLLCDTSLVTAVVHPSRLPGIEGPAREEIELSNNLCQSFARSWLHSTESDSEIPFEEDIMRIAILESLGGQQLRGATGDPRERHNQQIDKWIGQSADHPNEKSENPAVLLVRGLCTFIGGFGELLSICSSDPNNPVWGTVKPNASSTWNLAPAVFVLLNFALQALDRLTVRSLTISGRTLCDWRSSELSMQIPVAIKAIHLLRTGIAKYSSSITIGGKATAQPQQVPEQIGLNLSAPSHWEIVKMCDSSAENILQSVQSISHGSIDVLLDPPCLEWKNTIMASSASFRTT